MAGETLTTFQQVLKEFYPAGGIINQLNTDTWLLDKAQKAKRFKISGRYLYKPGRFGMSGGVGPRAENAALPTAGNATFDDIQVPIRFMYAVAQLSGPVIDLSKGDRASFGSALELTMDGVYEEFQVVANSLLWGPGSGILGVVGSVAGSVITLKDTIHPATWFYEGMNVDSYQSDESTLRQAMGAITNVDLANRKITVTTIGATAANDVIVIAGGLNAPFHGLFAAVDDSTYVDTYMGIQRSAAGRSKWKSYVNAQGGTATKYGNTTRRSADPDLIQQALDEQRVRSGGKHPIDQLVSSLGVRRIYWNGLTPDRRYNQPIFDGGWEMIAFSNGDRQIPWLADESSPRYTVFGLYTGTKPSGKTSAVSKVQDEEVLALYEAVEPDWDARTGGIWRQVYSSGSLVDAVTAYMKWYGNFGSLRPNRHLRVDDLRES